jgi:hypothetical protein
VPSNRVQASRDAKPDQPVAGPDDRTASNPAPTGNATAPPAPAEPAVAAAPPPIAPKPAVAALHDAVDLIAPTDLLAHAGRGGIHVFDLDESYNRIPEDPIKADTKKAAGRAGQLKRRALAAIIPTGPDASTEKATPAIVDVPWQEVTRGYRWVALIGMLDNKRLRENYARALKIDYGSAYPNYVRLDIERRQRSRKEGWSDWMPIDHAANQRVFDNLTEQDDDEWTPPEVRLPALVDILPLLRAGYWTGVHQITLVPKERLAGPITPAGTGMKPALKPAPTILTKINASGAVPEDTNFPKTHGSFGRQGTAVGLQELGGVGSGHVIHGEVELAVRLAQVAEGDDVRVVQLAEDDRLAEEPIDLRLRPGHRRDDRLQRDGHAVGDAESQPDDAHAASPQLPDQPVARDRLGEIADQLLAAGTEERRCRIRAG